MIVANPYINYIKRIKGFGKYMVQLKDKADHTEAKLQIAIDALEQITSMGPPNTGEDATLMREYAQAALKATKEG